MPLPTTVQLNIIFYGILSGIITGGMFDLYRSFRGGNVPKIIIIIEDILFWILAGMIVFCFLLYTNYAFLGPYVYIFMILSLIMYLKIISPICIKIELILLRTITKFVRVAFKSVIYPLKIMFYNIMGKNN